MAFARFMQRTESSRGICGTVALTGSVSLTGELDIYALAGIEHAFAALSGDRIVIDLSGARLVSAAFFSALVRLRRRLPLSCIEITGASDNVRRTFSVVGAQALVVLV